MTITTEWRYPTRTAQDDTVGDSAWVEQASITDQSSYLAQSFFLTFESFYLAKAHLVFNDTPDYANNEATGTDTYPFANLGGSSDTWGSTGLTGADVSNEKFGVALSFGKFNSPTYTIKSYYLLGMGFGFDIPDEATIDGIEVEPLVEDNPTGGGTHTLFVGTYRMRITFTWSPTVEAEASSFGGIYLNPPNRELPQKKHRYKVRSPSGDYLGDWKDVANEPSYKQDINNIIGSMPISFARNDLSIEPKVESLLNEDGTPLTNEDDSVFLIDVTPVSALGEGTNLDTNYDVEVDAIYGQFEALLNEDDTPILNEDGSTILVEEGYPLGRPIFRGYIPRWELPLSGVGITSEIRSYSQDLANLPLETEDTAYITAGSKGTDYRGIDGGGPTDTNTLGQTFTMAAQKTVSKIRLYAFAGWYFDVDFTVTIRGGTPSSPGTLYGQGTAYVNRNTPVPYVDVVFESPITLPAGSYCFIITTTQAKTGGNVTYPFNVYLSSTAYSGGSFYYLWGGKSGGTWVNDTGNDIAFVLYEAGQNTTVPFLSKDPSDILRSIVDFARGRGMRINYTEDSIVDTGTTVSYTFRAQTVKEAIEKVLELCPAGWYYYYDFGTDTIYLKERSATPDRWLRQGQTVVDGKIIKTIEQVVNDVLFTGGGDPALYTRDQDLTNVGSTTRRGLKKLSDNRVTVEATAHILSESEIDQYKDPLYAGDVTITEDGTFYLEDVAVGEMLGFIGFGSLVDAIVVQSVSKDYKPDTMPLALTYNVPRVNKRVEDIKRNLDTLETTNNPNSPS